jgi:putative phage-type endonuclease
VTATLPAPREEAWDCPAATLVLPADAPEAEWLAARRRGLGGSDASTIAGLANPNYTSLYTLWMDKTGRRKAERSTRQMRMGKLMEPVLAQLFTEDTGLEIRRQGLMRSKALPWMQVTLDGLTSDGGIMEFKTTNWRTDDARIWLGGDIPDHAECQSQWGMAVTGRSHSYAMGMVDSGWTYQWKRVERDDQLIDLLIEMGYRLWHHHVVPDVAPPVDSSEATLTALKALYGQADEGTEATGDAGVLAKYLEWRVAKADEADGRARARDLEGVLIDAFGTADHLLVQGEEIASRKQNGKLIESVFRELYPGLAAECVTTALDVDRIKKEHPAAYAACRARVLRPVKK